MYKIEAIILSINRIRDNQTRIVMVTREYGKITGWWSKKNISGVDIGDIVEILLTRNDGKNIIKSIEVKAFGWHKDWDYSRIIAFLQTIHIILKVTLDSHECSGLYDDSRSLIIHGIRQNISLEQYSIFHMRIIKSLGTMDPQVVGTDPVLRYIYDNVSHTPLERILSKTNIKKEHFLKIQQINLHSLHIFQQ